MLVGEGSNPGNGRTGSGCRAYPSQDPVGHTGISWISCTVALLQHWAAILTLIFMYRISALHPLATYPGPFLAKLSKLWMAYMSSRGKAHEVVRRLHIQYGEVVRIGEYRCGVSFILGVLTHTKDQMSCRFVVPMPCNLCCLPGRWKRALVSGKESACPSHSLMKIPRRL